MPATEVELIVETTNDSYPDVAETMLAEDVLILHGISLDSNVGSNSPLKPHASFADKVKAALAHRPELSTSTVASGENGDRVFSNSRAGLIINGGKIIEASVGDNSTVVGPGGKRGRRNGELFQEITPKALSKFELSHAIRGWHIGTGRYNELIVRSPKIAGIFIAWESPYMKHNEDYGVFWFDNKFKDQLGQLEELDLPVYVLKNGKVFRIENRQFEESPGSTYHVLGEEVNKDEITSTPDIVNDDKRDELAQEIVQKDLFRVAVS